MLRGAVIVNSRRFAYPHQRGLWCATLVAPPSAPAWTVSGTHGSLPSVPTCNLPGHTLAERRAILAASQLWLVSSLQLTSHLVTVLPGCRTLAAPWQPRQPVAPAPGTSCSPGTEASPG
eukprot:1404645-Pyramimonas_sp.AAC.1